MPITYRPYKGEDEWKDFVRTMVRSFGSQPTIDDPNSDQHELKLRRALYDPERSYAAFDGGKVVGTSDSMLFHTNVPGEARVPTMGVTRVTVSASHRRRGILRNMMRGLLEGAQEREEPLATLWASESLIYGRFGYGVGIQHEQLDIPSDHGVFAHSPGMPGSVRFVSTKEAGKLFPPLFTAMTAQHPGMPDRDRPMWDLNLHFIDKEFRGWGKAFLAVYEEDGVPQGYVNYRIRHDGEEHGQRMRVGELVGLTAAAHAALWRYVLDMDLVGRVTVPMRPVDDPVWWMLSDPRRMTLQRGDAIWLRLVDVAEALSRRTYAVEGKLVIEVIDDYFTSAGRYQLDGGPDGAKCLRGRVGEPDLVMGVAQLGATYFGGATFTEQARAGLVDERTPGSLTKADLMFSTERPPWCPVDF